MYFATAPTSAAFISPASKPQTHAVADAGVVLLANRAAAVHGYAAYRGGRGQTMSDVKV
jgi:hypothetical protein